MPERNQFQAGDLVRVVNRFKPGVTPPFGWLIDSLNDRQVKYFDLGIIGIVANNNDLRVDVCLSEGNYRINSYYLEKVN